MKKMESGNFEVNGEVLSSVYGPVHSRRHGLSLGVNVGLTQHKVCTWSCLYCQCGFGERRDYLTTEPRIPVSDLLLEIKNAVLKNPDLNSVTLAGNTEPGTYPEILDLMKGLQRLKLAIRAKWKIVILSNGSELDRDEVVQAFNLADEVWLKLDTGTEEQFHALNRPMPKVGKLSDHLARLKKIKKLRIQTLVWSHQDDSKRSNVNQKNFEGLVQCLSELKPLEVQLTTVARNPALPGVIPALEDSITILAERIRALNIPVDVFI